MSGSQSGYLNRTDFSYYCTFAISVTLFDGTKVEKGDVMGDKLSEILYLKLYITNLYQYIFL